LGDENSQNELVEETGMQSDFENSNEDQADNETDSQDEEVEGTSNILMQHEAYTAYTHYICYNPLHLYYQYMYPGNETDTNEECEGAQKVVIVYHCKPFDLNVSAYNYPYTTIIIPTEVLEILRKDETSYDIHTNAFSPFPSKSAALMFLLVNSTRPIVRVLLLQAVATQ